jgi:UPF0288 family protein (methanogenesis marker protein 3)
MDVAIYDAIREAGIDEKPAKNLAVAINKAFEQHYAAHSQQLATKGDTEQLRLEIEKVRAEIEKSRSETARIEANIIKWIVGSAIAMTAIMATIALTIARLFFTA